MAFWVILIERDYFTVYFSVPVHCKKVIVFLTVKDCKNATSEKLLIGKQNLVNNYDRTNCKILLNLQVLEVKKN